MKPSVPTSWLASALRTMFQPVGGQLALILEVGAERRVLHRPVSAADAEFDPPLAEGVDDRDVLGQSQRVLQRQDRDRGGQPDPLGARGGVGQERPRRGQPAAAERHVVLGHPSHVETQLVGDDEQLLSVAVGGRGAASALDVGEEPEPEARGLRLCRHGRTSHGFEHGF